MRSLRNRDSGLRMDKKKIRLLAEKLGKETLAEWLGVSVRTVQGWMNGRGPNPSAIISLKALYVKFK